jgi:DNA-directed RNA polymerase subunit omega
MEEQIKFDSKYRMVLVTARRARQLQSGSTPLVNTTSSKACRVAQDEIAAGFVTHVVTSKEAPKADAAPVEYSPILHS